MKINKLYKTFLWLTGLWTTFTVALAIWWVIVVLRLLDMQVVQENAEFTKYRSMITQEGFVLIFLLIGGGGALFFCILYLKRQNEKLRSFFATFTHELKTPLTNLRIQTEILRDKIKDSSHRQTVDRLANEGVRLELQLENSLFLAEGGQSPLFIEDIDLVSLISTIKQGWHNLNVEIQGEGRVKADRRALEAIFRNLLQNARFHGKANKVLVQIRSESPQKLIRVSDDGSGFTGSVEKLGNLFDRSNSRSGTGVGLWLIKSLSSRMGGSALIQSDSGRLQFDIRIPESL